MLVGVALCDIGGTLENARRHFFNHRHDFLICFAMTSQI